MITINNQQNKIIVTLERLEKDAQRILDLLDYSDFDLGILITDNTTIQNYNAQYRKKDKPTDILSFPFYPDLKPGERIELQSDEEKNLGDIIISAEYVAGVVKEFETTFDERMRVLLIHGICHLLGYDHETDEEFAEMQQLETFLYKKLTD